jgi:hypothetical protein
MTGAAWRLADVEFLSEAAIPSPLVGKPDDAGMSVAPSF